jgi:hypothetical protein
LPLNVSEAMRVRALYAIGTWWFRKEYHGIITAGRFSFPSVGPWPDPLSALWLGMVMQVASVSRSFPFALGMWLFLKSRKQASTVEA